MAFIPLLGLAAILARSTSRIISYNRLGLSALTPECGLVDMCMCVCIMYVCWKIGGLTSVVRYNQFGAPDWTSLKTKKQYKPVGLSSTGRGKGIWILNYSRKSDFNNMLSDPITRKTRTHEEELILLHLSSSSLSHPQSLDALWNGLTFLSNGCQLNSFFDSHLLRS